MLPFYLSGYIPTITDAFLKPCQDSPPPEQVFGQYRVIATRAFVLAKYDTMDRRIRNCLFTIAVLPIFGVGSVQLFAAEATGPTHDKVHPRIGVTAKWIWTIYLGLTITEIILLVAGGMNFFDSVCHSLTTTATGGYSTKQNSIAAFNSPYIEYIITLFMFWQVSISPYYIYCS